MRHTTSEAHGTFRGPPGLEYPSLDTAIQGAEAPGRFMTDSAWEANFLENMGIFCPQTRHHTDINTSLTNLTALSEGDH